MPDSFIQFPADGTGKKGDTEELAVGANTVHRERDQIAGKGALEIAEVKNTDPTSTLHGIVVRPINVVGPVRDALSTASLAAGSSANLDGTIIAVSKTGKLIGVTLASSAACKWVIKSRDGAIELNFATIITGINGAPHSYDWRSPDKRFTVLLGNGIDENFRVTVTNLDKANAADAYATIYWDEV